MISENEGKDTTEPIKLCWPRRWCLFCCGQRSHQELFETEAPDQVRRPSCLSPVKKMMSHPLPRGASEQLATSRLSLTVEVGLLSRKTTCLTLGSWNSRIKDHDGMLKKMTACKLCANARL
jgi:hypothetical protein